MSNIPATPAAQATVASPSAAPLSGSSLRKERGAIAAQACDTCRSRKQRCDEQRPKCGTCQKFKLECNYREPQPTKKDKTLVEILDRIKGLEFKIDSLAFSGAFSPPTIHHQLHHPTTLESTVSSAATAPILGPPLPTPSYNPHDASSASSSADDHYKYVSSVHQLLAWPAVHQLLVAAQAKKPTFDLSSIEEKPTSILGLHSPPSQSLHPNRMPDSTVSIHPGVASSVPMTVSSLNWDTIQNLSKAYFDSWNLLFPILDRHSFLSTTMPSVFNEGFGPGIGSTMAFLVFALGEVALAGSDGLPIHAHSGRPSGVKGGTKDQPPGLDFFNEARKRIGFNLTECSIENIQIFSLASMYYGSCFYAMDLWRMATSASLACQALITSNPEELSSPRADLVRRLFWSCLIVETSLHLEFGYPLSGLEKLEPVVGLPGFSGPFSDEDYLCNQESHFQEHFASQIVLRRLLVDFHGVLSQDPAMTPPPGAVPTAFGTSASGVNRLTMHQLALQLEQWRGMLPAQLRWQEETPGAFPNAAQSVFSTAGSSATPLSPAMPQATSVSGVGPTIQPTAAQNVTTTTPLMFTTDLDAPPSRFPFSLDIQVAFLRSRYYYTKYLIHRPFIYKAVHYPDAVTHDDAQGAAECLKATLKWPVAMSPTCTRKRLIPCLFFFNQNIFGILILLRLSTTVPLLRRIRSTLCGERFEIDASETVGLYLDWLRDLQAVDGAVRWQWEVAKALYGLDE
ncbi:hypothetical protein QBC47DRAFT_294622 [Echria macrotheca]|uniref:Zn(2)-C6 fungal-type domain-containing protein n=1 Tax=Echria macrotheca TaxID=438768 RepID=A0AAJ0BK06_9PEZI|nr:hypothetical protein QBC47DRAFT_294622 [Echria macrotheca]